MSGDFFSLQRINFYDLSKAKIHVSCKGDFSRTLVTICPLCVSQHHTGSQYSPLVWCTLIVFQ